MPVHAFTTRKTFMSGLSLYQKNLLFLETTLPALAQLARETDDTLTRPVLDAAGCAVDIDLGQGRLYNRPAAEFAAEQVASWRRSPDRVVVISPAPDSLEDECTRALSTRLFAEAGDRLRDVPREDQSGLLVVIGLGLGAHVRSLIEMVSPRHVVLIEPIEEFAVHSLHALDWTSLVQNCRARGTTIDLIISFDPRAVQSELEALITRFGVSCMDGAYSFMHYQTDVNRTIARGFRELAGMKSILQGYYADEKLMIENTIANVTRDDFWMIDGMFQAPHDLPLFIVGSGPSLDASLETIRKWQDHAIIFCAGSALQSLLAAGIKPDFQIEKENNETTEARIQHIFERHGKGARTFGVNLIASTTVQPTIVDVFDDTFLFHRELLSSTRMFANGFNPVVGTGPFSANTALAVATVLGFRDVYLFGCDCGSADRAQHHAQNTVYYTRDGHASGHADLPLPVSANFGGQAWSNPYFLWSRWVFESMIANAELTAFNCSDGVAIAGANPLRPDDLVMPGRPINKTRILLNLKAACAHQPAGAYLAERDVSGIVARWHAGAADVREFLDENLTCAGIDDFEDRLVRFIDQSEAQHDGVLAPILGSMRSMVPVAGYFLNRAPDPETKARFMTTFRLVYREQVERLLVDCSAMLDAINAAHGANSELRAAG